MALSARDIVNKPLPETPPPKDSNPIARVVLSANGVRFNVIERPDGTLVLQDASKNKRLNNPGNITGNPKDFEHSRAKQLGAIGIDPSGFAVFPTYEAGRKAAESLLLSNDGLKFKRDPRDFDYGEGKPYREKTLSQAIATWCPMYSDKGAVINPHLAQYIKTCLEAVGGVNKPMKDYTKEDMQKILDAMEKCEGYHAKSKSRVIKPEELPAIAESMRGHEQQNLMPTPPKDNPLNPPENKAQHLVQFYPVDVSAIVEAEKNIAVNGENWGVPKNDIMPCTDIDIGGPG